MKILVAGGGPAGLAAAALLARASAANRVTVVERCGKGETRGWGLTLRDHALSFLQLEQRMKTMLLEGRALYYRGQAMVELRYPPGVRLTTLSRDGLIGALSESCERAGVELCFGTDTASISDAQLMAYDVVVVADGANSPIRRRHAAAFGWSRAVGRNRYAWLATSCPFRKLTILLSERPALVAWAYQYDEDLSSLIVECTERVARSQFWQTSAGATCSALAQHFSEELGGRDVISQGPLRWKGFSTIRCQRLRFENQVLVGDAAHTTHFSQGFGTMFAFSDALALSRAWKDAGSVREALEAYESSQRPKIDQFSTLADGSRRWSEALLDALTAGEEDQIKKLVAARWPDNQITAGPIEPRELNEF